MNAILKIEPHAIADLALFLYNLTVNLDEPATLPELCQRIRTVYPQASDAMIERALVRLVGDNYVIESGGAFSPKTRRHIVASFATKQETLTVDQATGEVCGHWGGWEFTDE